MKFIRWPNSKPVLVALLASALMLSQSFASSTPTPTNLGQITIQSSTQPLASYGTGPAGFCTKMLRQCVSGHQPSCLNYYAHCSGGGGGIDIVSQDP